MKRIYILPNLVTTANFLCGIIALMCIYNGNLKQAAMLVFLAMVFDFFDGSIARIQGSYSNFGMEYDSLADLVSFGIAPVFIVYAMALSRMGRTGMGISFLYCTCAALRLARFNTQISSSLSEKKSFRGLPTPAAAGLIAMMFITVEKYRIPYDSWMVIFTFPPVLVLLSYLMVSNIRYPTLYDFNVFRQKNFLYLVLIVICIGVVLLNIEISLLFLFMFYALAGPLSNAKPARKWFYGVKDKNLPAGKERVKDD
ncbi:CDP-diacylglycerol--serine O-phosphatidyltransferase [bacterium]|nr:CDP-diacylglycerol--serine O-phosphatidyltransferase [bacterium]